MRMPYFTINIPIHYVPAGTKRSLQRKRILAYKVYSQCAAILNASILNIVDSACRSARYKL